MKKLFAILFTALAVTVALSVCDSKKSTPSDGHPAHTH